MNKHLTTLTALWVALLVPTAALAQDAGNMDSNADAAVVEAPSAEAVAADSAVASENTPAAPSAPAADTSDSAVTASAPVDASGKTEAQIKNEKLEEAQARFHSGQVGKYVYVPPETDETAAAADAVSDDDEDEEDDKSWSIYADMAVSLGLGAFTKNEHARKIRSAFAFNFGATYTIPVIDVTLAAETGFSQWLSKAGGTNGKYEFRWADTTVGLSRDIWSYKSDKNSDTKFNFSLLADLSFTLPTSKASINQNLYTTIMPTLGFTIGIADLSFAYTITYAHSFHEYTSSTYDPSEVDILARSTGNELLGSHDIAAGGVLTEIELLNTFALTYQFIKQLSLTVGLGIYDGWSYDNGTITKDDEYVGLYGKVGRGHSQYSNGTVTLAYTPVQYVTLTLGMSSKQPWKTADTKTIRFPWFDTVSPSKNYTKFLFGVKLVY